MPHRNQTPLPEPQVGDDSSGTRSLLHRAVEKLVDADYAKDKKAILGTFATLLGAVALGVGSYAAVQIIGHNTAIAVLQSDAAAFRELLKEQKEDTKENNHLLREVLQRIPRTP